MDERDKVFDELQREEPHEVPPPPVNRADSRAYSAPKNDPFRGSSGAAERPAEHRNTGYQQSRPQQPQQRYTQPQGYTQQPRRQPDTPPRYDPFMYQPLGFENFFAMNEAQKKAAAEALEKKRSSRRDKIIIILFILLIIIALATGILGIVYDVMTSSKRIQNISAPTQVVIYQNSKPEGADKLVDELDEHGRYSTEGVAAAVRESIVEIYTYADAFQKDLKGTGSGVVLNEDGYIVTNAHVLMADGFHEVHTADEKIYSATVVGRDTKTDIAVLKISAPDLCPAILGDSDEVVVGEQVIAIGNPAGLTGTVTNGIVSAVNRDIRSDSTGFKMNCIQTNAAISPGNSGGALVNMYGQVIGITSSKYISSYYEGLGFAITINEAKPIIEELINNGFIGGRFRIGITLIDMSRDSYIENIKENLGVDELPEGFEGIYIENINEDCDIANTALEPGDFITKINGTPVKTYDELYNTISASYGAGDYVPATCAHIEKDGTVTEYEIEFMLMEDTSGDY